MTAESLKSERDFQKVYKEGLRQRGRVGTLIIRKATTATRLGIVISGKLGNAVLRNRTKRLVREAFIGIEARLKDPVEMIFIINRPLRSIEREEIGQELNGSLKRVGVI